MAKEFKELHVLLSRKVKKKKIGRRVRESIFLYEYVNFMRRQRGGDLATIPRGVYRYYIKVFFFF